MIFQRVLLAIAAIAAMAAAAAVSVFAAAFAFYAFMRGIVGPAGAAASVAGAAALILVIAGLLATAKAGMMGRRKMGLAERAAAFARDKPVTAIAAALAAGFFAIRNPKTLAEILRELMEPKRGGRP